MSINQTILDGVFNMIMMCETKSEDVKDLTSIQDALNALGKELGVEIRAQHADIFLSMHRVGRRHYVIYRQYFRNESDDS